MSIFWFDGVMMSFSFRTVIQQLYDNIRDCSCWRVLLDSDSILIVLV
jgi:hypothetical protein